MRSGALTARKFETCTSRGRRASAATARGANRLDATKFGITCGGSHSPSVRVARTAWLCDTVVIASACESQRASRRRITGPAPWTLTSVPCSVTTRAGARRPIRSRTAAATCAKGSA